MKDLQSPSGAQHNDYEGMKDFYYYKGTIKSITNLSSLHTQAKKVLKGSYPPLSPSVLHNR
jgi:hypothetical protein